MKKFIIPADEKRQLEVYSHVGPFDAGVAALKKEGLALITACELAEARLFGGAQHQVNMERTWVAENFNYSPDGTILVASQDYNPTLKNPEKATRCHRNDKMFYLDEKLAKELREHAEADPEKAMKSGVLLLHREKRDDEYKEYELPSAALQDEPLTYFLFRNTAKQYGQFLKENGIDSVPVYITPSNWARKQRNSLGLTLYVRNLYDRSGLDGLSNSSLDHQCLVRGIRRAPAEQLANK